ARANDARRAAVLALLAASVALLVKVHELVPRWTAPVLGVEEERAGRTAARVGCRLRRAGVGGGRRSRVLRGGSRVGARDGGAVGHRIAGAAIGKRDLSRSTARATASAVRIRFADLPAERRVGDEARLSARTRTLRMNDRLVAEDVLYDPAHQALRAVPRVVE